ncbi:hypothetical protein QYE76_042368 [Lolium multiflorum]|uniref:Reverse transcriptase domain-containing protein n=1 Tax=Lolium multiflorum TaxID=4521 RepID=A0AAD8TF83_LOLMU|nr:hypothetical protein QYE76_042368 [Lolium multiflorum]
MTLPRQYEQGCHSIQSSKNRLRTPYLSATEQLEAPCYLHSYIDPKDCLEKSSHLLRNCRQFLEIRQFCDDLRAEATARVHTTERRAASYSYPPEPYIPEPYVPAGGEDQYAPTEVFPESRGQVSTIHKTSFSKREVKSFSREVKYAKVAMVDTPEYIDWSDQSISFSKAGHPKAVPRHGHAALVLAAQIGGYNMSKVFTDGGSGLNLLFASTMKAMGLTVDMLRESDTRFHGIIPTRPPYSLGKISLDVVFGTPSNFRKEKIEFEVVDWESQYHAILGRPAFAKFMAVPHNGTALTVDGSFSRSDSCDIDFQKIASKFGAREELNAVDAVTDHAQPPVDNRNESALIEFLHERWKIFAWEPFDMPGIPRELAKHALNVDPKAKPVQQSMRRFSEPKRKAIGEEVSRLRKAGFIRELKESEWVANPVMVPKKDTTTIRMCIDYTSLNKHCPKDHFPLPRIDQIVDSTAGCDRLSFLDAYSGYNQIKLKKEDQDLTAFITPHGIFCYTVMTFGLKYAGATYHRCMQACLGEQIGRNIEVYIDDIVVKTKHAATLIDDLRETFDNLDRKRTPDDAEELLAKIGRNHDDWSTPEPTPTPIVKKRGMIKLNDEDMREAKKSLKEKGIKPKDVKNLPPIEDLCEITPPSSMIEKRKMKKFKFGELFKKGTTSTGRPSRASTQIRRSYNEDVIAPSFAPEEDNGVPNASSFPCYDFLTNAGILDDFFTLVNRAGLATYVEDEREQYYMLTKIFVESFKFHNAQFEPIVAFKIYDIPVTMELEEFCRALDIAPVGTARRIDDNPRDLLELYRGITEDDCRTIHRGKIRNIQLPAIKYFAYYIATSILGRENTSNISSYHLAFLNAALTGETSYHLGSLIARRLSSRGPIFGGTIALRILTHLKIPLDSNDVPLTPRRLDIAAMKSHHFVTTDSTINNMVYRMLFADGNEKEIPLPQPGLFNIDRQSWSLTKEAVEEHMKIQEFHQQHDSENAEPSYDYTVTYPDVSSSTYLEPGRSSSYYGDTTSWGPWE